MFVTIVDVRIKPGLEGDFARSFSDANAELSACDGFVARRLLRADDGPPSFRIIVEHDSRETFEAMRRSDAHAKWHSRMTSYMEQAPVPRFFKVVAR